MFRVSQKTLKRVLFRSVEKAVEAFVDNKQRPAGPAGLQDPAEQPGVRRQAGGIVRIAEEEKV
jgi:hypothetical protein